MVLPKKEGEIYKKENDILLDWYMLYERTRAIENQAWFISSNWTGYQEKMGGGQCGHSNIITPRGVVLASASTDLETEELAIATVDIRGEIRNARMRLNYPRDRQPHTYGLIPEGYQPPAHYPLSKDSIYYRVFKNELEK